MLKIETVIFALAVVGEPRKEASKNFEADPRAQQSLSAEIRLKIFQAQILL